MVDHSPAIPPARDRWIRHIRALALALALSFLILGWAARSALAILPPQVVSALPNIAAQCPPNVSAGSTGPCEYVPPPYPYYGPYGSEGGINAAAQQMSNQLLAYIEAWMAGKAPAQIPRSLIPDGILPEIGTFTLVRPDQVTPRQQWGIRTAFDFSPGVPYQYHGPSKAAYPDPHTTYFLSPAVFVPFGTKVIIHGQFPRARFFDLQPSPSFDANYYREESALGNQETPIVDADINPDCGSINPFRVYTGQPPSVCTPTGTASTSQACASHRHFRVPVPRQVHGRRVRRATVYVRGRRARVLRARRGGRLRAHVDLRGLPRGAFRVRIVIVTAGGRRYVQTHTYHTCVTKRRHRPAPPHRARASSAAVTAAGTGGWDDGDRNAPNERRNYTVTFTAAMGDPTQLDRAATFPFRDPGNHRYMGPIQFQGPWGCDKSYKGIGAGLGCWDVGDIWGRYYAPDPPASGHEPDPFADVGLPKITYELPDGRQFYILTDFSKLQTENDITGTPPTGQMRAPDAVEGPSEGWHMEFSILRIIVEDVLRDSFGGEAPGLAVPDPVDPPGTGARAKYVRDEDHGAIGHDQALPSPHNQEHGATEVPYINYLIRILAKETGHVVVITGTLPTVPDTRRGLARMTAAQARYLSFTCYTPPLTSGTPSGQTGASSNTSFIGVPIWSVMDDQITLDAQRHYALVLSAPGERPRNATTANHVTWMNYGPTPECHITLRWMSIAPQWYFSQSPTEDHLGWATDLASLSYDPSLLNTNNNTTTFLGQYQPVIHYMTTAQFEALGDNFDLTKIPPWQQTVPGSGF